MAKETTKLTDTQMEYWQATAEQHKAGQQLLAKLEWLQKTTIKLPQYVRAEIAEIVALARKAVI